MQRAAPIPALCELWIEFEPIGPDKRFSATFPLICRGPRQEASFLSELFCRIEDIRKRYVQQATANPVVCRLWVDAELLGRYERLFLKVGHFPVDAANGTPFLPDSGNGPEKHGRIMCTWLLRIQCGARRRL